MKIDTTNIPPKSENSNAAQLEIPFAQLESLTTQPETQSTFQLAEPSLQEETLDLVEEAKRQAQEMSRQKVQKKKRERVKAAFNLMDYIVKYYNTGETYISRAFTLAGMVSLIALGANRLTALEGGLSNFVPPLDILPNLLTNLQTASPSVFSDSPQASKVTPMESSFEQVTRLQPVLVSPSFAPTNQPPSETAPDPEILIESAPAPVNEPVAPSASPSVENAPWVSPTPEIPAVSLPLPEINHPLPTIPETIIEAQQEIQQAAEQLNQVMTLPEIVPSQPTDLGETISEVQQGFQQITEELATEQLGQIDSPSIPIEVDALTDIPNVPNVPNGIMGIFGGDD